jgi:hypothetical protein
MRRHGPVRKVGTLMSKPLVHVETLVNPRRYVPAQIEQAVKVAQRLARGKFVLCESPKRDEIGD